MTPTDVGRAVPSKANFEAVVMGASAGALHALSEVLVELPQDYLLPIFIVVHLPADRDSLLTELLHDKCQIDVHEAEDKEPIHAGSVYVAPRDYHLLIEKGHTLSLSSDEPVLFSRPSVDVLFESAAEAYGNGLLGIILTGANEDGAQGLKTIVAQGGAAWVQSPSSASTSTMPAAALQRCPEAQQMTLEEIRLGLFEIGKKR